MKKGDGNEVPHLAEESLITDSIGGKSELSLKVWLRGSNVFHWMTTQLRLQAVLMGLEFFLNEDTKLNEKSRRKQIWDTIGI